MIVAGAHIIGDLIVKICEMLLKLCFVDDIREPVIESGITFRTGYIQVFEAKVGVDAKEQCV